VRTQALGSGLFLRGGGASFSGSVWITSAAEDTDPIALSQAVMSRSCRFLECAVIPRAASAFCRRWPRRYRSAQALTARSLSLVKAWSSLASLLRLSANLPSIAKPQPPNSLPLNSFQGGGGGGPWKRAGQSQRVRRAVEAHHRIARICPRPVFCFPASRKMTWLSGKRRKRSYRSTD